MSGCSRRGGEGCRAWNGNVEFIPGRLVLPGTCLFAYESWGAVQATLKLPEYTGMGGAQNTSVILLGEVLGVAAPAHAAHQHLETICIPLSVYRFIGV